MNLRLVMLGADTAGGSALGLAGGYGHEVTTFADLSSSVADPDGPDPSMVHGRKEYEGMVGEASPKTVFDVGYGVLVEVIPATLGDTEPGFSHAERALADDRHVVLASKGPVAERHTDLRALEAESGGTVQFEAAVDGVTPILSTISDLGVPYITAARGILNGTANFILSRIVAERLDYEHVLTEAQDLSVVKADLTFNVDDIGTVLKSVILMNVLSDGEAEHAFDDAAIEGIHNVPGTVLDLAAEGGRTVKLIGEATTSGIRVVPWLIPQDPAPSVTGT